MTLHAERTWPEVTDPGGETLLVPVGSTEQHGPHLPFDTDTRLALAIARAAAAQVPGTVVAPAVPYGSSGEHQAFAGTLSIGTEALTAVLTELGRSATPPFRRIVVVNGHGGNVTAVTVAVQTLTSEGRSASAWWPDPDAGDPLADAHAGHTETSLLLARWPESVRADRVEVGNVEPVERLLPQLMADGVRPHSPNGVLGDPTTASADHGRGLFDRLVADLVLHLEA